MQENVLARFDMTTAKIYVRGELVFAGNVSEKELRNKVASLKRQYNCKHQHTCICDDLVIKAGRKPQMIEPQNGIGDIVTNDFRDNVLEYFDNNIESFSERFSRAIDLAYKYRSDVKYTDHNLYMSCLDRFGEYVEEHDLPYQEDEFEEIVDEILM